jgi:RNA polymerase sigma factor (sigma-70 family)
MKRPAGGELRDLGTQPDQLEAFYLEHLPFVRRYLARRLHEPADVADLTADVFTAVIESAHSYRSDRGSPRAWLTGVMRNLLGAHHQARVRQAASDQRLLGRRLLDEDSTQRIVDRIDAEDQARQALASLRDLPPALRDVVELVAVDGLSLIDAAAVLGVSAGTARVRYHRARRALQHSIALDVEGATS